MSTTVVISAFHPFPSCAFTLPVDTLVSDIPEYLPSALSPLLDKDVALNLQSGVALQPSARLSSLLDHDNMPISNSLISFRLTPRIRGGKGGFGSQLRAAGGRMSSQKTSNNDSCRDLNGRRLSTVKEAKALAAYLEEEPARKKAQAEAQRAKLEALERKLGIDGKGKDKEVGPSAVKRRFDDTEYLEQSRELVDNVKSAVAAGLLKKKKKAKTTSDAPEASAQSTSKAASSKSDLLDSGAKTIAVETSSAVDPPPTSATVNAALASVGA